MDKENFELVKYNLLHVFLVAPLLAALGYNLKTETPNQKYLQYVAYAAAMVVLLFHLYKINEKLHWGIV